MDESTEPISSFRGEFDFLSNFYAHPIMIDDETYPTAEHAFQALKTDDHAERELVRQAATPVVAKQRGKKVTLRANWDTVRFDVMERVLRAKFANPELAQKLFGTGHRELIEGNSWRDTTWGCTKDKDGSWKGRNELGKLLMKIRSEMKAHTSVVDFAAEESSQTRHLTQAGSAYMAGHHRLVMLHAYLSNVAEFARQNRNLYIENLGHRTERISASLRDGDEEYIYWVMRWELHSPMLYEMEFCKAVDLFLDYISDIIALVYLAHPETMKSNETVTLEFILEHDSMPSLVAALTEKRVTELAFKGIKEVAKYCERSGIQLFISEAELEDIAYLIEVRNIIVHNKGIVSKVYKQRLPSRQEKIGDEIKIELDGLMASFIALTRQVLDIDRRIGEKFTLPKEGVFLGNRELDSQDS